MKDINLKAFGLFNLLGVLLSYLCLIPVVAQAKYTDSLPPTPAVLTGQLENGFTYYIKPLESGKQVQMELLVKSGFQRQVEGERELAHFIEHLAINQFINKAYQSNGRIKNAFNKNQLKVSGSTGFDHTRYSFYYPQSNSYLRDIGLNYFSEIAMGSLQLDPYIVNTEKAVFFEEVIHRGGWRTFNRDRVDALLSDCLNEPIFPDSLWNYIKSYNVNQSQEFLENWYRPELSSLVIVGPIKDMDGLRTQIEKVFSSSRNERIDLGEGCSEKFLKRPSQFIVVNNENNIPGDRKEVILHLLFRDDKKIKNLSTAQWEWIKPVLSQSISQLLWKQNGGYNKSYAGSVTWHEFLPILDFRIRTLMGQEAQGLQEAYAFLKGIKKKRNFRGIMGRN